jgi:hypothetical protein
MKAALGLLCLTIALYVSVPSLAAPMASTSFSIEASGFSCGGTLASSSSFRSTATIAQATPVSPGTLPASASFLISPGLRYLLEGSGMSRSLESIYLLLLGE